MKILFVCLQYIHSARWINQLKDSYHEIYVFDCLDAPIHEDLKWANTITNWSKRKIPYIKGEHFLKKKLPNIYESLEPFLKVTASEKLKEIIKDIQPDLVHTLEMQTETYPLISVRKKIKFQLAYFCWGNDIYAFQENSKEMKTIKKVLKNIDFLYADTTRDIKLANQYGYSNDYKEVFPGGGGYRLNTYQKFRLPIESRNLIIIKGYQHSFGRALVVLEAIESIIPKVQNFDLFVYSAHQVVINKIHELNKTYGLGIKYSSRKNEMSQEELLELFGKSLIAIGNSISDGIPNTLLESIIVGAFPIQSNPGGATEDYINDDENGFLISNPEDSKEIANKILKAIESPDLIKQAYNINQEKAKQLEYTSIKKQVIDSYKRIEQSLLKEYYS